MQWIWKNINVREKGNILRIEGRLNTKESKEIIGNLKKPDIEVLILSILKDSNILNIKKGDYENVYCSDVHCGFRLSCPFLYKG